MVSYHSGIPTFRDETSTISSMFNNTILTCDNYNSEKRNFIVVDEVGIRDHFGSSVETAYNNHWITDFPSKTEKQRIYRWTFPHTDINHWDNYCLHQDVLKDSSKFNITVDGVFFDDFSFVDRREYAHDGNNLEQYYTQHLLFDNGYPTGQFEVTYTETIEDINYDILTRLDDDAFARNKAVTLTITDNNNNSYFLDTASVYDHNSVDCVYTDFSNSTIHRNITKGFSTHFAVRQYKYKYDFTADNLLLECYKIDQGSTNKPVNANNFDRGSSGTTFPILKFAMQTNSKYIEEFGVGVYNFRFFNTVTHKYSNWFHSKLSVRQHHIWTTDATVSNKNYAGWVFRAKTIR